MQEIIIPLVIVLLVGVIAAGFFLVKRRKEACSKALISMDVTKLRGMKRPINRISTKQSVCEMMKQVDRFELSSSLGQQLSLSTVHSQTGLEKKKFQEITVRGSAIGSNLVQGAIPTLAHAQTLASIARAAPNGLFTATAPLSELMKYKDGTIGSIVMKGSKVSNHSGFQEVIFSAANPAAVVAASMQAMAMISGQYYMDRISGQLNEIERGIEKLIGFHHDQNIGKLRSIENQIKEVVCKKLVDHTDIIAIQSGIRDADSVLLEYSSRLERLVNTGEITDIEIRRLRSLVSAAKEIDSLKEKTEEHELTYSFQICLFASNLMLEGKKAEFATRMKMGEPDKAMEVLDKFVVLRNQSFLMRSNDLLERIYEPIDSKAGTLIKRQWMESKKAKDTLQVLKQEKASLRSHIGAFLDNDLTHELVNTFSQQREVLYLPGIEEEEQRMFISVVE